MRNRKNRTSKERSLPITPASILDDASQKPRARAEAQGHPSPARAKDFDAHRSALSRDTRPVSTGCHTLFLPSLGPTSRNARRTPRDLPSASPWPRRARARDRRRTQRTERVGVASGLGSKPETERREDGRIDGDVQRQRRGRQVEHGLRVTRGQPREPPLLRAERGNRRGNDPALCRHGATRAESVSNARSGEPVAGRLRPDAVSISEPGGRRALAGDLRDGAGTERRAVTRNRWICQSGRGPPPGPLSTTNRGREHATW